MITKLANVVLGLFSPFKFEIPNFHGYDIKQLRDNVRFLEVIINRGGSPGGIVGLYFDGAVNFFKELPKPDEMNTFYNDLKRMRVEHLCVKIADNMTKNSIINNIKNKIKVWLKF